jgi:hypothetical protein
LPDIESDVVGLIAEDISPEYEDVPELPDWQLVRSAGLVGYARKFSAQVVWCADAAVTQAADIG